ncbi:MAG: response regulator transcription factor [Tepidisphaeraceae bacterium]
MPEESEHKHRSSVFVVDDDPLAGAYAAGIAQAAGYCTRVFHSASDCLDALTPTDRGCVLLDLQMDGMGGLELQSEFLRRQIHLPVIIISGEAQVSSAVIAMKQQAFDFFEKPVDPAALLSTIRRAVEHDARQAARRIESELIRQRYNTLSAREKQVMHSVVHGMANKQIAAYLTLSEKTIEVHRSNVMRKMQVDSVAALVKASLVCTDGEPVSPAE